MILKEAHSRTNCGKVQDVKTGAIMEVKDYKWTPFHECEEDKWVPIMTKKKTIMYQALIKSKVQYFVTVELYSEEQEAIKVLPPGYTFVKLLTDRPIEVD